MGMQRITYVAGGGELARVAAIVAADFGTKTGALTAWAVIAATTGDSGRVLYWILDRAAAAAETGRTLRMSGAGVLRVLQVLSAMGQLRFQILRTKLTGG